MYFFLTASQYPHRIFVGITYPNQTKYSTSKIKNVKFKKKKFSNEKRQTKTSILIYNFPGKIHIAFRKYNTNLIKLTIRILTLRKNTGHRTPWINHLTQQY